MLRYVRLCLDVDILGAVKAWGTAGADSVGAEDLYSFLFQGLISDEVEEIVGGEINHGAAIR